MSNSSGYNPPGQDPYGQGNQPYGQGNQPYPTSGQSASGYGQQYPSSSGSANYEDQTVLSSNPGQTGYNQGQTGYSAQGQTGYGQTGYDQSQAGYNQGQTGYGQTGYNAQGQTGYGQQPYGQQNFQGQGATTPQPPKKKTNPLVWILAIGLPLLLILGLILFFTLGKKNDPKPGPTTSKSTSASATAANDSTPEGAMRGYLQALIDGDSDKALGYIADQPTDKTMLTKDVLKTLKDQGRGVSKINSVTGSTATVTIGNDNEYLTLNPKKVGDKFKVSGLTNLKVSTSIPLTLAGVALKPNDYLLPAFPGIYEVKSGSENFSITENPLEATSTSYSPTYYESVQLTPKGQTAAREAAKKSLNDCFAQKKLAPVGCPYKYKDKDPNGNPIDESTVKVSLVGNNPLDTETFRYSSGKASAYVTLKTHVEASSASGQLAQDDSWFPSVEVDMAQTPAKVTWKS